MKYLQFLVFIVLIVSANTINANLLISPTRINFDSKDRVHEVILINTTTKERTYRVGWSEKKAKAEGGYEELAENDNSVNRLSPYIRFSPRQVRLGPGEKQKIKIQIRKKSGMNELEYRSHLKFTALPADDEQGPLNEDAEGMRMKINTLVSYSIPVLYHPSKPSTAVSLLDYKLKKRRDDDAELVFTFARSGDNTAYGRIEIYAKQNGDSKRIGLANNVALFKELDSAATIVRIPNFKQYQNLNELTIKYIGEKEYNGQTLLEQSLRL